MNPSHIFGVLPAFGSPSLDLCEPSAVALPSSTLIRRLVPSEPIRRRLSANPEYYLSLYLLRSVSRSPPPNAPGQTGPRYAALWP